MDGPVRTVRSVRTVRRQLHFDDDKGHPVSQKIKKRQYNDQYRQKMTADPLAEAEWKRKEAERLKAYRKSLAPEKKEEQRQKRREREARKRESRQAYNLPKSRPAKPAELRKPSTRAESRITLDRREKNRISQQKRRANMSSQKKRREKEKNRNYMRLKRSALNEKDHLCTGTPSKSTVPEPFRTPSARSSAVHRLKKIVFGGARKMLTLKYLLRSVNKKNSKDLTKMGIFYASPSKGEKPSADLQSILSTMKKSRRKDILQTRSNVAQAAEKVFGKYFTKKMGLKVKVRDSLYRRRQNNKDNIVKSFFEENSIHLPDKKSVSKKTLSSKKILDKSICALFQEFVRDHGSLVARATFFKKRPKHVLSFTKTPFKQCMCEICLNPLLKMKVLNSAITNVPDLLKLTLCNNNELTMKCLKRECDKCGCNGMDELFSSAKSTLNPSQLEVIQWKRWEKVLKKNASRMDLVQKSGSFDDLSRELKMETEKLALHNFVHRWQTNEYSKLIKSIPKDWAVLTLDFAENYLCRQQDQPQGAYFGYTQVTLHPCVLYFLCDCGERTTKNIVYFSDDLDHSANFVHVVMEDIFHYFMPKGTRHLVVFSDNCSSQYKSKLPFFYFQSYACQPFTIERCFFGARHGKNPCDALGGVVKQAASRAVQSRQTVIQSADDLFRFASTNLSLTGQQGGCSHAQREFRLINSDAIPKMSSTGLKTVPGTREIHSVLPTAEGLKVRNLSCFCHTCKTSSASGQCDNSEFVSSWKSVDMSRNFREQGCQPNALNDGFLASPLLDISQEPTSCMDRAFFFQNLIDNFSKCILFSELASCVDFALRYLHEFPLPDMTYRCIYECGANGECGSVDKIALGLVPSGLEHLFPLVIASDGNCVPRSISVLIFGTQEQHIEVRCRIIIESVVNLSHYLSLPSEDLQFLSLLSDFHSSNIQQTFEMEILDICKLSTFMGMWQLMAASNAFQVPVCSVYPRLGQEQYFQFYNRSLQPLKRRSSNTLVLLWSTCRDDMNDEYWVANHVVPLLPLTTPTEVILE